MITIDDMLHVLKNSKKLMRVNYYFPHPHNAHHSKNDQGCMFSTSPKFKKSYN
jgi:hypothetical protein